MKNTSMSNLGNHFVNGNPVQGPFEKHLHQAVFAMGCFWGVEKIFWQTPGVFTTAVGYAGGLTPNPDYQEVCGERFFFDDRSACVASLEGASA